MTESSKSLKVSPAPKQQSQDESLPSITPTEILEPDEFDASSKIKELAIALAKDTTLLGHDDYYFHLADQIKMYLSSGYKDKEIQGELSLTKTEFLSVRSKFTNDWWEACSNETAKLIARKRARLLKYKNHPADLAMVQTLDEDWNPKTKVDHNIHQITGFEMIPPSEQEQIKPKEND